MNRTTTILVPADAQAYLYDAWWRPICTVKVNGWWEWHGVRIPGGTWLVAEYVRTEDGAMVRDSRGSDVVYQLGRLASGMRAAWCRDHAEGDGYETTWRTSLGPASQEWATDEQMRAL